MVSNERSPLARLVLFLVCLSLVGMLAAGAYWYVVDLPQQNARVPVNSVPGMSSQCERNCFVTHCVLNNPRQPECDRHFEDCRAMC
jgi:hypothetical protein